MSNISVYAKTKFILKMIDNIKKIITKHGGIVKALEDELEAQPAILMALLQIGESLNKIDKEIIKKYDLQILSKFVLIGTHNQHPKCTSNTNITTNITRNHLLRIQSERAFL